MNPLWLRAFDKLEGVLTGGFLGFVLGMWYCRRRWLGHYRQAAEKALAEFREKMDVLNMLCFRLGEELGERTRERQERDGKT